MIRHLLALALVAPLAGADHGHPAAVKALADLDAAIVSATAPAPFVDARRRALLGLMRSDPLRASAHASPAEARIRIAAVDPAALERTVRRKGTLVQMIGCTHAPDMPHDPAQHVRVTLLVEDDDRRTEISIPQEQLDRIGSRVEIRGIELDGLVAGSLTGEPATP
jgi:hypothetical protein